MQTNINFLMEVLINLFHYEEKECIPMNTWIAGKDETLLPNKEDFYSCLNMEYITDSDHGHAKNV